MDGHSHSDLWKSALISCMVGVPVFCLSVFIMESKPFWASPALTMLAILGMTAANFAAIIFLEYYRSRLSRLSMPVMFGAVGLVLLYIIAESVNRFILDFGYDWLFPIVAVYLLASFIAIFSEKLVLVKLHIGINAVVIAVLWTLGAADKIALPF